MGCNRSRRGRRVCNGEHGAGREYSRILTKYSEYQLLSGNSQVEVLCRWSRSTKINTFLNHKSLQQDIQTANPPLQSPGPPP